MTAELKLKKLAPEAQLPIKATEGAGCFDFFVHRVEQISHHQIILYFGLAAEVPEGYIMTLQPRSSFTHKGWVMANTPGQIDSDYRGELQVRFDSIPRVEEKFEKIKRGFFSKRDDKEFKQYFIIQYPQIPYKVGDRCVQAKLEVVQPVTITEVQELTTTERRGGFGSTGQ